jgi:hypothetical protein
LQEAVLDGSLDSQIEQAADSVKARFAKWQCSWLMVSVQLRDAHLLNNQYLLDI